MTADAPVIRPTRPIIAFQRDVADEASPDPVEAMEHRDHQRDGRTTMYQSLVHSMAPRLVAIGEALELPADGLIGSPRLPR